MPSHTRLIIIKRVSRTSRTDAEIAFGRRLCSLLAEGRKRSNKSIKQVAETSGLGMHGLYAVERGQVLSPSMRTVYLLAQEYALDLTDLARKAAGDSS